MGKPIGLFIETTGIQNYIFNSNKLRLNLGASYIIEHLLMDTLLLQVLNRVNIEEKKDISSYRKESQEPKLGGYKIAIGYNGGGNCLLFCESKEVANDFIDQFSLEAMLHFPGINLAATTLAYDKDDRELIKTQEENNLTFFQAYMKAINLKISKERSDFHIISRPLSPGYVRKDIYSLGYVDILTSEAHKSDLISIDKRDTSVETLSKLEQVKKAVAQHEGNFLTGDEKYSFPTEFEDVCLEDDQGFIAVVHIDGNGMGRRFMEEKTIQGFQKLSEKVKNVGKETVKRTVEDLIRLIEDHPAGAGMVLKNIQKFYEKHKEENDIPLPFRPIISGGDDITFVTDGRLGIYMAQRCVENFIEVTKEFLGEEFHACAGVAIVKRKYPFIRAYYLAEELIKSAKKVSRADGGSYIDMYISNSGISGSLDYIRSQTHSRTEGGNTYLTNYGPYLIASNQEHEKKRPLFADFITRMQKHLAEASLSKVQQLRVALYNTEREREAYLNRLQELEPKFYEKLKDTNTKTGRLYFEEKENTYRTPWIDAIYYRDFYPLGITTLENATIE